ncbi:HlyD family secretion protein [Prosthecomicrobium sp. N25]|uniref:HlyD family secretion protein n=1 Tax=Prosthecomicrobium sp. N25 TaxID=3129254 RepID=UPI003078A170
MPADATPEKTETTAVPREGAVATAGGGLPATAPQVRPQPEPRRRRRGIRFLLMVLVPLLAAAGGFAFYLHGGRYVSTDNSYVGAEKVLITPEVSGRVVSIAVTEGQPVQPGDPLFQIDPEPYRLALREAEAKVEGVRSDLAGLKTTVESLGRQIDIASESADLREKDLERKQALYGNKVTTQTEVETVRIALATARAHLETLRQQRATALDQLLGKPQLAVEDYPPYREAVTRRDRAARDLENTLLRSPIAGVATQVPAIQMGRYLSAGTTVFAIVATDRMWVDANPKETDLEFVTRGQPVEVRVDTYPDKVFRGTVESISPGTGAQFSILPPQNASGNWVKVVQRIPVRVAFDAGQDLSGLRAGMSADVAIDTGRQRSLAGLFGLEAAAGVPARKPPLPRKGS